MTYKSSNMVQPVLTDVSSCAPRLKLDLQPPRFLIGFNSFATPPAGVLGDFTEGPANRCAIGKFSFLDNVFTATATDQFSTDAVVRVEPVHPPGLNRWVVNSNGRTEPVREFRGIRPSIRPARVDKHILNRPTFEHPCEMCFANGADDIAVIVIADEVQFPTANQESVEVHRFWYVGRAIRRRKHSVHRIGFGQCCFRFHENEHPARKTNCK